MEDGLTGRDRPPDFDPPAESRQKGDAGDSSRSVWPWRDGVLGDYFRGLLFALALVFALVVGLAEVFFRGATLPAALALGFATADRCAPFGGGFGCTVGAPMLTSPAAFSAAFGTARVTVPASSKTPASRPRTERLMGAFI
jgi:hypothetical protein